MPKLHGETYLLPTMTHMRLNKKFPRTVPKTPAPETLWHMQKKQQNVKARIN
jgi:hypothetical protein